MHKCRVNTVAVYLGHVLVVVAETGGVGLNSNLGHGHVLTFSLLKLSHIQRVLLDARKCSITLHVNAEFEQA